jgi:hypothetical protein
MDDELEAKSAEKREEAKQLVLAGIQGPVSFLSSLSATQTTPRNGIALHPMRFSIPDFSNEILECGASGSRQADFTCSHVHITCSHLMSACLMHMPAYLCTTNQLSRIWPSSL